MRASGVKEYSQRTLREDAQRCRERPGGRLPVGRLRVAGRLLDASERDPAGEIPFEVAFPARYALIGQSETPTGVLDGTPYDGARFLDAGPHGYAPGPGDARIAVIWAQAAERGFSPFGADR